MAECGVIEVDTVLPAGGELFVINAAKLIDMESGEPLSPGVREEDEDFHEVDSADVIDE